MPALTEEKPTKARMTRRDAGRLGGQRTKERHAGKGFYHNIGQIGGKSRRKKPATAIHENPPL
jgi:hypothetical protein